jgi:hypothetical protein
MPVEDAPPDPAGRVLEADIRDHRSIGFFRRVRSKADAGVKRLVHVYLLGEIREPALTIRNPE